PLLVQGLVLVLGRVGRRRRRAGQLAPLRLGDGLRRRRGRRGRGGGRAARGLAAERTRRRAAPRPRRAGPGRGRPAGAPGRRRRQAGRRRGAGRGEPRLDLRRVRRVGLLVEVLAVGGQRPRRVAELLVAQAHVVGEDRRRDERVGGAELLDRAGVVAGPEARL